MKLERLIRPAAIAVALVTLLLLYNGAIGREAVLKQQIKAREKAIAVLAVQHRTDTLRLVTVRRHTDSILSTVTDTFIRVDTVRQIVQAERNACDQLVRTCEQEKALLRAQIVDLKKPKPFLLRIGKPVLPFLGGVITGLILTK